MEITSTVWPGAPTAALCTAGPTRDLWSRSRRSHHRYLVNCQTYLLLAYDIASSDLFDTLASNIKYISVYIRVVSTNES